MSRLNNPTLLLDIVVIKDNNIQVRQVRGHGGVCQAGGGGGRAAADPRGAQEDVGPLDGRHEGLVHLQAALVGAQDTRIPRHHQGQD